MRLFRKEKAADGRRTVYVLGMRLFSYGGARRRARSRSAVAVNGRGNVVRNRNEGNPHLRIRIFGDGNYVQVDADRPVADICIGAPDCPASNCRVVVGEGRLGVYLATLVWSLGLYAALIYLFRSVCVHGGSWSGFHKEKTPEEMDPAEVLILGVALITVFLLCGENFLSIIKLK